MPIIPLKKGTEGESTDDVVLSSMDRRIERHWITPQRIAIGAAILAGAGALIYAYVTYGLNRTFTVGSERLTVSTVSFGTFHEYIPITGSVVPRTTVYLDAVEGGQVTAVNVEEGAFVKAGDPLVALKNTNLQLAVISAEAQMTEQYYYLSSTNLAFQQNELRHRHELLTIGYQIENTTRHLEQRRPLVATGLANKSEIEDLEADLDYYHGLKTAELEAQAVDERTQAAQVERLRDSLDAMNRNLSIARENLDNLMISAPIAGQLTLLEANVGESKAPGQRVGQIDEVGSYKVTAPIDEFYLTRVVVGQQATMEIDGKEYKLEIAKVYPEVRNRQFEVDLLFLDSPPDLIRRGQTVRMRLEIGLPTETLIVANGAFYDDTGGLWAFVLAPSGDHAERHAVRLGRRNPEGIEVLEGLSEGDRVITSSYENFRDFDRLQFND
jgi:HlyD family secretion protein